MQRNCYPALHLVANPNLLYQGGSVLLAGVRKLKFRFACQFRDSPTYPTRWPHTSIDALLRHSLRPSRRAALRPAIPRIASYEFRPPSGSRRSLAAIPPLRSGAGSFRAICQHRTTRLRVDTTGYSVAQSAGGWWPVLISGIAGLVHSPHKTYSPDRRISLRIHHPSADRLFHSNPYNSLQPNAGAALLCAGSKPYPSPRTVWPFGSFRALRYSVGFQLGGFAALGGFACRLRCAATLRRTIP